MVVYNVERDDQTRLYKASPVALYGGSASEGRTGDNWCRANDGSQSMGSVPGAKSHPPIGWSLLATVRRGKIKYQTRSPMVAVTLTGLGRSLLSPKNL